MDLVSFETQQEYDWVKGFIDGGVKFFWTSGRKFKSHIIILKLFPSAIEIGAFLQCADSIGLSKGATLTGATSRSSSPN